MLLGPTETFLRSGLSDKMCEIYIFFDGQGHIKGFCPLVVRIQFPRDECGCLMRYYRIKNAYIWSCPVFANILKYTGI